MGDKMRISKIAALGALTTWASIAVTPKAQAAFIVTIEQVGANVVVTGSGTIELGGLTYIESTGALSAIGASDAVLGIGSPNGDQVDLYSGFSGPASFG